VTAQEPWDVRPCCLISASPRGGRREGPSSLGFHRVVQGGRLTLAIGLDAVAFSVVRHRCKTLWASVFAHGFNNTIGFVAFFVFGPIHGFW
jgi:hypothetical protein